MQGKYVCGVDDINYLKTFLTWKLNDKGKESRFQARGTHRSLSLFSISCPVQQTMNARTK